MKKFREQIKGIFVYKNKERKEACAKVNIERGGGDPVIINHIAKRKINR